MELTEYIINLLGFHLLFNARGSCRIIILSLDHEKKIGNKKLLFRYHDTCYRNN